jgi:hypothetical protein
VLEFSFEFPILVSFHLLSQARIPDIDLNLLLVFFVNCVDPINSIGHLQQPKKTDKPKGWSTFGPINTSDTLFNYLEKKEFFFTSDVCLGKPCPWYGSHTSRKHISPPLTIASPLVIVTISREIIFHIFLYPMKNIILEICLRLEDKSCSHRVPTRFSTI